MEDRFDRLESMLASLRDEFASVREDVKQEFVSVRQEFVSVKQEFVWVRQEFVSVRQEFVSIRQEIRQGDADTRSQLGSQIESVRDDIRIFAEAHLSLEKRVTRAAPSLTNHLPIP